MAWMPAAVESCEWPSMRTWLSAARTFDSANKARTTTMICFIYRASWRKQFNFTFHFHRNVEWQFCHADGASGMRTLLGAKDLENEVAETVDDGGLPVEARSRVDH